MNKIKGVVFIDRDGVINYNRDDYVKNVEELVFLQGALTAIDILNKAGMAVIVISNQSGVANGFVNIDDLIEINCRLYESVKDHGGRIHGIYYCIHKPEDMCDCRKPEPGLIFNAREELNLSGVCSYMVGDALSDIIAGIKADCTTILVLSGRTSIQDVELWNEKPDYIADDLLAAAELIISRSR